MLTSGHVARQYKLLIFVHYARIYCNNFCSESFLYGNEEALFLSTQRTRLSERAIQFMIKKYTTALFGPDKHITAQTLASSFKNNVYNRTHAVNITAALTGCLPCTLVKEYAADIDEVLSTTILSPDDLKKIFL